MKLSVHDISLKQFHIEHSRRIAQHYAHAREKHPHFCDWIGTKNDAAKTKITKHLEEMRLDLSAAAKCGQVDWAALLDCEMWEVFDALANGDKAHAVEELYDCAVICLRTIDMLEGRQKLGKPETNL